MIILTDKEEKLILNLAENIKYGDPANTIKACEDFELLIKDFPIECLLQHTNLLKVLIYRFINEQEFPFHNFALPLFSLIIERLSSVHKIYDSIFSKPSEIPALDKVEYKEAKEYLEYAYPCVNNEDNRMDSVSSVVAIKWIMIGAIETMVNKNKVGASVILYTKCHKFLKEKSKSKDISQIIIPVAQTFINIIKQERTNEIIRVAVRLCELIESTSRGMYYDKVPMFISVLEDSLFTGILDEEEAEIVKGIARVEALNSLKKANEVRETINYVNLHKDTMNELYKANIMLSDVDIANGLTYAEKLISSLEFHSTHGLLLTLILLKSMKFVKEDNKVRLETVVIRSFRSPYDSYKLKFLKSAVAAIKEDLNNHNTHTIQFLSSPSISSVVIFNSLT